MSKERIDEFYDMIAAADGDFDSVADPLIADLNAALDKWNEKMDQEEKLQDAITVADHLNDFVAKYYSTEYLKFDPELIIAACELLAKPEDWFNSPRFLEDLDKFLTPEVKEEVPEVGSLNDLVMKKGW